jgi:hypothetical protein
MRRSRKTGAEGNRSQIGGGMTNIESGDAVPCSRATWPRCVPVTFCTYLPASCGRARKATLKAVQLANAGVVRDLTSDAYVMSGLILNPQWIDCSARRCASTRQGLLGHAAGHQRRVPTTCP